MSLGCPSRCLDVQRRARFEAKVYFVDERSGAYRHGDQQARTFQEFWIFRRHEDAWRLHAIERSHISNRRRSANYVPGLADAEQVGFT
jgi:hypothetical protein